MTWEEAFAFVNEPIGPEGQTRLEMECAEQGVTVALTDPVVIAESIRLMRIGRRNYEASQRQATGTQHI